MFIAMNQDALDKHIKDLKEEGILIVDATYVKTIPKIKAKIIQIPATQVAEKTFGNKIYANMLMLGVLTKITGIINEKAVEKAIEDALPEDAAKINKQAYRDGEKLIQ
jgi:2-oxoglutarate ferredoxin oxidoreductase subunit gamma